MANAIAELTPLPLPAASRHAAIAAASGGAQDGSEFPGGNRVTDITHASFTFSDFRLQNGEVLPEVTIAYATRGKLGPDGRNAILVTHGYTSGQRMIEPGVASSEGAWSTLVG